jgi:type II secretory pathway component GspD/PulD (secretin)
MTLLGCSQALRFAPMSSFARAGAARSLRGAALLVLAGCLAPPPDGEQGSAEDFAGLVSKDAQPVRGTIEEGQIQPPHEDPAPQGEPSAALPSSAGRAEQSPYLRFGERIQVHEVAGVTFVTKPYPMPSEKAARMLELMKVLQPFPFAELTLEQASAQDTPPDPDVVEFLLLRDWDFEYYDNFVVVPPAAPSKLPVSDLLVVTATPERLAAFESFLDTFAAGVPQIEIEAKIIEIVETDTTDLGVKPVPGKPIFDLGDGTFIRSLDFNLSNTIDPTEALLTLGAVQDGAAFNAIIEAVQSWENVSIESRPRTVVRAGGMARIESTQEIPFFVITGLTNAGGFNATLQFKPVGTKLYIVPRVIGTKTLALDVHLEASQVTGSQVSFVTDTGKEISNPVVSARTAKTVVYLEPGQTLVIGGLTNERNRERVQKVPVLGDIPLLGLLFRSKLTVIEKQHVMFAISPRIVQRNEFNTEF